MVKKKARALLDLNHAKRAGRRLPYEQPDQLVFDLLTGARWAGGPARTVPGPRVGSIHAPAGTRWLETEPANGDPNPLRCDRLPVRETRQLALGDFRAGGGSWVE